MSQLASLSTCQMPLRLGFPSGVRGIALDGAWAKPAVIMARATINIVLRCFISFPSWPHLLRFCSLTHGRHSRRFPPHGFLRDTHTQRFDRRGRVRAE